MPFEEGHERYGGRAKGTTNKKTLLRASSVLAEMGISPTAKLVEIAEHIETKAAVRIEIWKFLHSFVEAPQTTAQPLAPESPEDSVDRAKVMAETLSKLSQPLEPSAPSAPPQS